MKKNGSVLLHLNIWRLDTLILCLVGVLNLSEIQRQHKTFIMPSLLTSRQKNYCLRFLVNRLIIELLLQCIKWLHNSFFASASWFVGKNDLNHSGKCNQKIFPRLTEISVSFRRSLGYAGKLSAYMNWTFLLVKISIMARSCWNYFPA